MEVQDHIVVVNAALQVVTHVLHAGIRTRDIDDYRGTRRGFDREGVSTPQSRGRDVEDVLARLVAGQGDDPVSGGDRPVGRQSCIAVGQAAKLVAGRREVDRRRTVVLRPVRQAEHVEVASAHIVNVSGIDLTVDEGQVAANDERVFRPIGIVKPVADPIAGEAGVVAHGHLALDVAVKYVRVFEDEGTVAVGNSKSGCRYGAAFEFRDTETGRRPIPLRGGGIAAQPSNATGECGKHVVKLPGGVCSTSLPYEIIGKASLYKPDSPNRYKLRSRHSRFTSPPEQSPQASLPSPRVWSLYPLKSS